MKTLYDKKDLDIEGGYFDLIKIQSISVSI